MTTQFEQKLSQLDLSAITTNLKNESFLADQFLMQAEDLYRQFLILKDKYPNETLVPPKAADTFWHGHMLESRQYDADCQMLFGHFLHHTTKISEVDKEAAWQRTRELYQSEFGVDPSMVGDASNCN